MILITQLIYIHPGQEDVFNEFEAQAIPIITRYNGRLLFRLRPKPEDFIESNIEQPYEIHLVEFDSADDFEAFKQDKERQKFLHLKEQSVRSMTLIQGSRI